MASRVIGVRGTTAALRALARFASVPLNEASRHALAPTLAAAKELVPVDTGLLRRSLVIRRAKSPKISPRHFVGPSTRAVGPGGERPVKYAHLVEFGRAPNGAGHGAMAGSRFLTAAYEATKDLVVRRFGAIVGPAIEKRAASVAAKLRK